MIKKNCRISGIEFVINDRDFEYYKKLGVPPPSLCPAERRRRRFAFRNERFLYKRKSNLSGKEILACVHPSESFKIYEPEEWWGDAWDAADYGRDYDFDKPFFDQFYDLFKEVPLTSLHIVNNQNCPYANYVAECKNCYMIFGSVYSEDCFYGNPYYCRSCIDSLLVRDSELCYNCITCEKCYGCFFCQDCVNSQGLFWAYDCLGCSDCIGCAGLRNKKYHIFNKAYSKDEYEKFKKGLNLCNPKQCNEIELKFKELKLALPHRAMVGVKIENCTGNYIYESKNTFDAYDVQRCWDCAYLAQVIDMKDCQDCNYTEENELCYEYIGYYRNNNVILTLGCFDCNNLKYCSNCISSGNLFGCAGMRRKQYCILNKQYSREEYEDLLPRIIEHMKSTGEWGEFFPVKMSPFCYNESVAQEYFPITKDEALARGYRWREKNPKEYLPQTYAVPGNIADVPDAIIDKILACGECGRNFKIILPELKFYKKMELPIPKNCPDCRHKARLALRTPRNLWDRKCDKCGEKIKTSYAPERPEIAYCEKCYHEAVY